MKITIEGEAWLFKRIHCLFRGHEWRETYRVTQWGLVGGPLTTDERKLYDLCARCGKITEDGK